MTETVLTHITEHDFNQSDPISRVVVHDHPRRYASLLLSGSSHALFLSWRSDLLDPIVVSDPYSSAVWIGVDQRFACVSAQSNTLLSVGLGSPLLQIKCFESCVVALCEIEVLVINRDYSVLTICDLREIAEDVDLKEGKLIVTSLNGEKEVFPV